MPRSPSLLRFFFFFFLHLHLHLCGCAVVWVELNQRRFGFSLLVPGRADFLTFCLYIAGAYDGGTKLQP